jgi:hypothetical protein
MRKTMITMATVALASGLFAGTALAGGDDEGKTNVHVDICQPQEPAPLVDLKSLTGSPQTNNLQCMGQQ